MTHKHIQIGIHSSNTALVLQHNTACVTPLKNLSENENMREVFQYMQKHETWSSFSKQNILYTNYCIYYLLILFILEMLMLVPLDKVLKSQTFFLHLVMFEKHVCFSCMLSVCMFHTLKFSLLIPISVAIVQT